MCTTFLTQHSILFDIIKMKSQFSTFLWMSERPTASYLYTVFGSYNIGYIVGPLITWLLCYAVYKSNKSTNVESDKHLFIRQQVIGNMVRYHPFTDFSNCFRDFVGQYFWDRLELVLVLGSKFLGLDDLSGGSCLVVKQLWQFHKFSF